MLKLAAILLFVVVLHSGDALECYKCDDCGPDVNSYEKESCDGVCVAVTSVSWIVGRRKEDITRSCVASKDHCNELNAKSLADAKARFGDNYPQDFAPLSYECAFCESDLCNGLIE